MLYKRQGYPEVDEIVLCKVTKLFPNSVFVELSEYGRTGLVHISEVAPGRIRNLRDFVSLDRQIVCKVLTIDKEKGHIDLSLRRVNSHQRQEKLEEIKQEGNAETLLRNLSKKMQIPMEQLYAKVSQAVFKEYSHLYLCFQELVSGTANLEKIGLDKKIAQEITAAVIEKFKPSKITLEGEIKMQTYHTLGADKIRFTLLQIEQLSPRIRLFYLGGGRYRVAIEDNDYKPAEKTFEKIQEIIHNFNDKLSTATVEKIG